MSQEADTSTEADEQMKTASDVQLDTSRQEMAVDMSRTRLRLTAFYNLVSAIFIVPIAIISHLPWFLTTWSQLQAMLVNSPVFNWQPVTGWSPLLILLVCIAISILIVAISAPFAFLTKSVLSRRYKQSKMKEDAKEAKNWWKHTGFFLVQIWLLIEVIMLIRAVQPQMWWAWAGLLQFLYSILSTRFGPVWIQPLFNIIEPLPEGDAARRIRGLMERLHVPPCGLYVVKISHRSDGVNAQFSGFGSARRILLTDTMLQKFTLDEIEVIAAHELGHFLHRDIWTRLFMRGPFFLGIFLSIYLCHYMFNIASLTTISPIAIFDILSPILCITIVLLYGALVLRYMRYQEYQADEFALQVTGNVQAFKNAMTRLANMNMEIVQQKKSEQNNSTHPTLLKRLKHADEFAARQDIAAHITSHSM